MTHNLENARLIVKERFSILRGFLSGYLYGSSVRGHDFDSQKSDIDVLLVFRDDCDRDGLYALVKEITAANPRIDITLIYESEYALRLHPGWSKYFYYHVKHAGELVCGEDLFQAFDDSELNFDEAYARLVELTQRIRLVHLNPQKEEEERFWLQKYAKWVLMVILEFTALEKTPIFSPKLAFAAFMNAHAIDYQKEFSLPFTSVDNLLEFLETTREWILRKKPLFVGKQYSCVFFDLGQTIMDSDPALARIDEEFNIPLWQKRGYNGTPEELKELKKQATFIYESLKTQKEADPTSWSRILAALMNLHVSDEEFWEEIRIFNDYYCERIVLSPHAREILDTLHANNIRCVLISNGWTELVHKCLRSLGIDNDFEHKYISEAEGLRKSELMLFRRVLAEQRVDPSECLMVGDRLDEDAYCRKLGIDFAWYCRNPHYVPTKSIEKYDYRIMDLFELRQVLRLKDSASAELGLEEQ